MLLILGDDWFDFRHFPNLMPKWLGVDACQIFATLSALGGNAGDDILTLIGGYEWTIVFFVSRLTALFLIGLRFAIGGFIMGMGRRRWYGGICRRDYGLWFEFGEASGKCIASVESGKTLRSG